MFSSPVWLTVGAAEAERGNKKKTRQNAMEMLTYLVNLRHEYVVKEIQ